MLYEKKKKIYLQHVPSWVHWSGADLLCLASEWYTEPGKLLQPRKKQDRQEPGEADHSQQ